MDFQTGQTITEIFLSTDAYNTPVTPATFDSEVFKNGQVFSEPTFDIAVEDAPRGIYRFYFTPSEAGTYQVYINNLTTNVLYTSDVFAVLDNISTIYVGL